MMFAKGGTCLYTDEQFVISSGLRTIAVCFLFVCCFASFFHCAILDYLK